MRTPHKSFYSQQSLISWRWR